MDPVFAIRGLLSFVAFSEWTTALRCLWPLAEEQSYVNARLFGNIKLEAEAERTLCHTYGLFSALVGLIIIHAAVYAHYRPLVSLALSAISLKLLFLISEAFIFGSVPTGQHLIFPVVTGVVSALVTIALLFITANGSPFSADEKEDLDFLKKQRKQQRKNK